jgi:hypothetical protein
VPQVPTDPIVISDVDDDEEDEGRVQKKLSLSDLPEEKSEKAKKFMLSQLSAIHTFFSSRNEARKFEDIPPAKLSDLLFAYLCSARKGDGSEMSSSTLEERAKALHSYLNHKKYPCPKSHPVFSKCQVFLRKLKSKPKVQGRCLREQKPVQYSE